MLGPEAGEEELDRLGRCDVPGPWERQDLLDDLGPVRACPGQPALRGCAGQRVVRGDVGVRDTQQAQRERGHHPGPVLAGRAVERERCVRRAPDQGKDGSELVAPARGHVEIAIGEEPGTAQLLLVRRHVPVLGLHGVVVVDDALGLQPLHLDLVRPTQVDDRPDPELGQAVHVLVGEALQAVGPEQAPPAHRPVVDPGVAAEVPQVEQVRQLEVPVGGRRHRAHDVRPR